jgi:hypothetical protein
MDFQELVNQLTGESITLLGAGDKFRSIIYTAMAQTLIWRQEREKAEWKPLNTAPRDGRQFIAWDGERQVIANWPEGCAIGEWTQVTVSRKKQWDGSFIRFNIDHPKAQWRPLPLRG